MSVLQALKMIIARFFIIIFPNNLVRMHFNNPISLGILNQLCFPSVGIFINFVGFPKSALKRYDRDMSEPPSPAASSDERVSERTKIEKYLKHYQLQECLDEAINELIDIRPANPYMHIAKFMEDKTMAEIMDLKLRCIVLPRGLVGVEALVTTNLAVFTAQASISRYATAPNDASLLDFSVVEAKAKEELRGLDPCKLQSVDRVILEVPGMTPPVALAISAACCRAGARHSGKTLSRYLAGILDMIPRVPTPVVSVCGRAAAGGIIVAQLITVIPTTPTFVDGAIESCMSAARCVYKKLDELKLANSLSDHGCPVVMGETPVHDLLLLVGAAIQEEGVEGIPKLGIDYRAVDLMTPTLSGVSGGGEDGEDEEDDSGDRVTYQLVHPEEIPEGADAPPPPLTGAELAVMQVALWKATGIITLEDPLASKDTVSLDVLYEEMQKCISEIQLSDPPSKDLAYNLKGLAGEERCLLQLVADRSVRKPKDLDRIAAPFNTVKIDLLSGLGSVYSAMEMCQLVKHKGMALVVGVVEDGPETLDSFVADFSVAVGAGQFYGGGMGNAEYTSKYTRLVEIAAEDEGIRYAGRQFRNQK